MLAECSIEDIWDEWDRGISGMDGLVTLPIRELFHSEDKSWKGSSGSTWRSKLLRRKRLWLAMEALYTRAEGSKEERRTKMLAEISKLKSSLKRGSMDQLSEYFSNNPV